MEDLYISGTPSTPEMKFNAHGELEISGKSIPTNAAKIFEPVFSWLENYSGKKTTLSIKMEYFNTSTSKVLYDVLLRLQQLHKNGGLLIKWFYEEGDEDVLDTGHYYESLMGIPFEFYVMSEYEILGL